MPTTRTISPHSPSGMDATTPPHLVANNRWIDQKGLRTYFSKLTQFPLWKLLGGGPAGIRAHQIFTLPTGPGHNAIMVLIGSSYAARYAFDSGSGLSFTLLNRLNGTLPTLSQDPGDTSDFDRIQGTVYNNHIWFTGSTTKLRFTDGTYVGEYSTDVPAGRYIDNYFDHIIVANSTFKGMFEPWHVRWSGLYNPGDWVPTEENEADFFEITGWQRANSVVPGVTGLGKINDVEYVYTDSCICRINYVGLPKVMQFAPVVVGWGNFFLYSLVVTKNAHFFFDGYHQNFFVFDGVSQPQPIGDEVIKLFLDNFNLSPVSGQVPPFGFSVPERHEVWWSFMWNDLSTRMTLVYNWKSKEWAYFNSTDTIFSVGGGEGTQCKMISDLTGTVDGLASSFTVDKLGNTGIRFPKLITSFLLNNFALEATADSLSDLTIQGGNPTIESKDFHGDLQEVAEVDRLCIHADYVNATGIDVYVSVRQSIHDAVTYKKVGTWTKNLRDGIISFTPMKGRIVRYKFIFVDTVSSKPRGCVFYSFTDNLFSDRAER